GLSRQSLRAHKAPAGSALRRAEYRNNISPQSSARQYRQYAAAPSPAFESPPAPAPHQAPPACKPFPPPPTSASPRYFHLPATDSCPQLSFHATPPPTPAPPPSEPLPPRPPPAPQLPPPKKTRKQIPTDSPP